MQGAEADKEYYEYEWGDRAEAEVKKSDVLKMVCQVYDVEPRMFKEQYDLVRWFTGCSNEPRNSVTNVIVFVNVNAKYGEVLLIRKANP